MTQIRQKLADFYKISVKIRLIRALRVPNILIS